VDEAAKQIVAFDLGVGRSNRCVSCFGRDERERAMRPLRVVVAGLGAEHVLEVAASEDEQPVEALGADGAHEPLREGVGLWRTDRGVDRLNAFAAEHLVEAVAELGVSVVDQEPCSFEQPVKLRLRTCWVTQAPVGLVVQPARWTRRFPSSMKNST
jgi:hypothetical protein